MPVPKAQTRARIESCVVGPLEKPADRRCNLVELFKEIVDLGTIEAIDGGQASDGIRRFRVITTSTDNDLLDLFTFHVARELIQMRC